MKRFRKLLSIWGRLVFVLFILVSAFVFAMFQGGYVSWAIFYAILPFILYSLFLFLYPLRTVTAERIIRTPSVENGGKLVVSLTVKRDFPFPLLYTVISEKWSDEEILLVTKGAMNKLFVFGFQKKEEWQYEIERMPRGEHVLEGVEIEVSDFFGWIRKKHFIPLKNTVLVYPKMTDIHYVPIDTQYDLGSMISPYNVVKDTTMATGVRDYQSGDRVSWIHWKSFARTQTLMTKEFEDRRSQDLLVIFDGRPSETFEEQVELAASILKEATNDQAGIGFLTTGTESATFPYIQSEEQFRKVLIHLAKIKPSDESTAFMSNDYRNEFSQSGSVILITAHPDWAFLESVIGNVTNARSITCFTVVKKDAPVKNMLAEDIRLAKSKGISVHTLTKEQFPTAFKGVIHA
ncbi:DUF58 domain-containing protein [Sporosarcina sp. Marseille-Q4063]|uniref:DUF58 domain-containing protein n=1 Tax=Sporosarcina sp. Marseille-Q4063 TaxID=2810514 RepID=UPI001BAF76BE|nr:DUF58 domain-containing protein [Sporosarcina sp. Marseille-Q4063]QUW23659.1 DUF58 domain-containing protein [Sporosarcina sp. Marseille-Q4063]